MFTISRRKEFVRQTLVLFSLFFVQKYHFDLLILVNRQWISAAGLNYLLIIVNHDRHTFHFVVTTLGGIVVLHYLHKFSLCVEVFQSAACKFC